MSEKKQTRKSPKIFDAAVFRIRSRVKKTDIGKARYMYTCENFEKIGQNQKWMQQNRKGKKIQNEKKKCYTLQ